MKTRAKLHLPFDRWPLEDRLLWEQATNDSDPFGEATGARLAVRSKHQYLFAWRRFLGFVVLEDESALVLPPAERLTKERVRAFASHLSKTNIPRSVAIQIDALYKAARIMLPSHDLAWLKAIKSRLHAAAPLQQAGGPAITSLQILQVGLSLMDQRSPINRNRQLLWHAIAYRDGLMIALLLSRHFGGRIWLLSKSAATSSEMGKSVILLFLLPRPRHEPRLNLQFQRSCFRISIFICQLFVRDCSRTPPAACSGLLLAARRYATAPSETLFHGIPSTV
jgi:hypothetical protein